MIRLDLTKTVYMNNDFGICLPNSLIRCILNSEKLSIKIINETKDILGESPKTFYEKHQKDLFNYTSQIYVLIGMYCEIYLLTHHTTDDIIKRMLYVAITSGDPNELEYRKFDINRHIQPEMRNFLRQCDVGVLFGFPHIMRNDDALVASHNIKALIRDTYICTDMILQKRSLTDSSYQHVVFYNVLENIMQDNEKLYYVPYNDLISESHEKKMRINLYDKDTTVDVKNVVFDGYEYAPELLHFQNMRGYKTKICEFLTQSPTLINLMKRLNFLIEYVSTSTSPYKLDLKSYSNTLRQVFHFYSIKNRETFKNYICAIQHVEGYNYLEELVSSDGRRFKSSKLLELLYDTTH